ncbi:unnamed protein product [Caenorhabditis auriculariae]|uniref:LITAF domain-containing protein n=1 Tax=Caenorhabditis auriculariae TaxID=2777116 RepID=A0A8S1HBL8_9PELO|nr:unnamed protein product [Caenorhabditis auriculariae]
MAELPPSYNSVSEQKNFGMQQPAYNPQFGPVLSPNNLPQGDMNGQTGYTPQPQITTIIVGTVPLGSAPMRMQCPHCQQQIITQTEMKSGLLAWLLCGGLVLFGCWLCCCIPFCINACQDMHHSCPNCRRYIGTYRRI